LTLSLRFLEPKQTPILLLLCILLNVPNIFLFYKKQFKKLKINNNIIIILKDYLSL
jgi:hypothetical protein